MKPCPDLDAAFAEFDAANPHVYAMFCRLAARVIERGRDRYSADGLIQLIRWETNIVAKAEDEFKISDWWTSRYARKWQAEHPEHPKFFDLRTLRSRPPEPGKYGRGPLAPAAGDVVE